MRQAVSAASQLHGSYEDSIEIETKLFLASLNQDALIGQTNSNGVTVIADNISVFVMAV